MRRRDLLIILSIWVVGCSLVALLLSLFYANRGTRVELTVTSPPAAATYNLTFAENTAKAAYLEALAAAQDWQNDVELVAISAHWPEAAPQTLASTEAWDFRFYSSTQQRAFFALARANQPAVGRAHLYKQQLAPTLIDPTEWEIDSNEAISIWLNNGGGKFLETYAGSSVELLLRELPDQKNLVWEIISVSPDQSQLFYLTINARDGSILN